MSKPDGKVTKRRMGYHFGHAWYYDRENKTLHYMDDDSLVPRGDLRLNTRPCPRCGLLSTNGQDPCIENIPNVDAACCGHGVIDGYIKAGEKNYRKSTDEMIEHVRDLKEGGENA